MTRERVVSVCIIIGLIIAWAFYPCTCAAQTITKTIAFDKPVEMAEQAQLLRAANEWNAALQGAVKIVPLEPGAKADWSITFNPTGMERGSICEASYLLGFIRCRRMAVGYAEFGGVLLHEVGHLFGLDHSWGTLMHPYCCSAYRSVDAASAALVKRGFVSSQNERK